MAVLEGFKKVSIALVGAYLAGAVFFGFKVAGAFVAAELQARDYLEDALATTTRHRLIFLYLFCHVISLC
jgi:hypothetical protein